MSEVRCGRAILCLGAAALLLLTVLCLLGASENVFADATTLFAAAGGSGIACAQDAPCELAEAQA